MYKNLEKIFTRLNRIYHLSSIAGWDEAVMMPVGGGDSRAKALAEARMMAHELLTGPQMADWIAAAEGEKLNDWQRANLREIKKQWTEATAIDAELVGKLSLAGMKSEQQWRVLRGENNWKAFEPYLTEVVKLTREEARQRSEQTGLSLYDALKSKYEPGFTSQNIENVFEGLKRELPLIIDAIIEKQKTRETHFPKSKYPIDKQKELGLMAMKAIGFNFDHGRLDVSHHPFCGGVPQDVRMTTRYHEDNFFDSFMGVIHETGHACYEQNLPHEWMEQPVGTARGMATHESQSLFVEMQMGRSLPFLKFVSPFIKKQFHNSVDSEAFWTEDNLFALASHVERGFIRVEADEATYPLHIILRFELERDLIEGRLEVKDLPTAWNEKMQKYLGLSTLGNDKNGCMQDVHWPSGSFGYFPDYTLGALIAAQLSRKMREVLTDRDAQWARGDFKATFEWLKNNVWSQGSKYASSNELLTHVTGEPLNAQHFVAHLKNKYLS